MVKKILIMCLVLGIFLVLGLVGFALYDFLKLDNEVTDGKGFLAPLAKKIESKVESPFATAPTSVLADDEIINVLLLGIDRRSKAEAGYRTDIMILASLNKATNRVVLTSIPRDLWYNGGRINATYVAEGWEGLQTAFSEISGMQVDRFVLTDFEDFSWIVDALGGVPVTVETTFTDSLYPVDATKEYQTVHFTAGPEVMTGERALIFSRSRKGDNDNGDWGRMKRQHLLLKGMVEAATQPKSFLCELAGEADQPCATAITLDTLEKALKTVTTGKMDTNLELGDVAFLWDFYKDKDLYTVDSLLLDYEYLHTPPADEYGGAWVLVPSTGSYSAFQAKLRNLLSGVQPTTPSEPTQSAPVDETLQP